MSFHVMSYAVLSFYDMSCSVLFYPILSGLNQRSKALRTAKMLQRKARGNIRNIAHLRQECSAHWVGCAQLQEECHCIINIPRDRDGYQRHEAAAVQCGSRPAQSSARRQAPSHSERRMSGSTYKLDG